MNLPFNIAKRYLFARKSTNAINIITGISVFGITIQTAAFILVLSVFNGFEELLLSLFSNFNPEVKITPKQGKTFAEDTLSIEGLMKIEGVAYVAKTLEETAFFEYKENRAFGTLKGVDSVFQNVSSIDSTIRDGKYALQFGDMSFAVLGAGMKRKLRVNIDDDFTTLNIYMPKQKRTGPLEQPFRKQFLYPIGSFAFQQDFDNKYIITNLSFTQRLLDRPNTISSLELKLHPNANSKNVLRDIKQFTGKGFKVQDRYQQDEAFLKLMNIEKWLSFAILTLTLLLVAFNLIGSLWMIVLEKKKDISILKSMGAHDNDVRNIFLYEGALLCSLGLLIGFIVAILFYTLQKTFGIIPIPEGFIVNAYPMSIRAWDFLAVTVVVLLIGLLASLPAAYRAKRIAAMVREE